MPLILLLLLASVVSAGTSFRSRPETFAFWYEPYRPLGGTDPTLDHLKGASFVVSDGWEAPADLASRKMDRFPYLTLYNSYRWAKTITQRDSLRDIERWLAPVAFYHPSLHLQGSPPGMAPAENSIPTAVNFNPNEMFYALCPNSQALHHQVLKMVRDEMKRGARGVFIDNGYSDPRVAEKTCRSPFHRHVFAESLTAAQAYLGLLQRVRQEVKAIDPEALVLVNGLLPPKTTFNGVRLIDLADGQLWESFLRTSLISAKEHPVDWTFTHDLAIELEKRWLVKGRPHAFALSYPYDRAEAYFCYATAKLSNLPWAAGIGRNDPDHRINGGGRFGTYPELLSVRLGNVLNPQEWGGVSTQSVYYRAYDKGIVVVNPTNAAVQWSLPTQKRERYRDLWSNKVLTAASPAIDLPPESGRVLLRVAR